MSEDLHPWRWFWGVLAAIAIVYGLGVLLWPVTTTIAVAKRVTDPDAMLMHYRWFHDAKARLEIMPAQIAEAQANLKYAEANAPERAMARMTEFTGIKQVCQGLVGEYNARAERFDSGFLRNPEGWLPVDVSSQPYEPLPGHFEPTHCQGEQR